MKIPNVIQRTVKALAQRYSYSTFELSGRPYINRPTDARSLVDHYRSWVYICASRNAETIAGIPLRLYARGGSRNYYSRRQLSPTQKSYVENVSHKAAGDVVEITENHPLLDLLDYVNGEHTRSELLETTVMWQEITGDAYWYLELGPLGTPVSIWPLMSPYVRVVRAPDGSLTGYLYGKSETDRIALKPEEVVHFRYPNPRSQDYGMSPLEACFGAAVLLESQQAYEQALYDSGGMPEVGLMVKGELSAEERKRMYAEWRSKFASKRAGDKFIIMEGDCDIKTFGLPPKDVGVQFTQRFSREEVAAAFGVPMTLLEMSQAAKAGAEAGHYAYSRYTIAPKLKRIADKITEQLCAQYDERLFVLFDDPIPSDVELRLKEIQVRLGSRMTSVNEERAIDGLGPAAWGDLPIDAAPQGSTLAAHRHEAKLASPPLTAAERSFRAELEEHFDAYGREAVRLAQELLPDA